MKVHIQAGKRPRIEMLPLIDIVFLLLVFFIYAMLSMTVHKALPVALPQSSTAKIDKKQVLSITILSNGGIYLDKQKVLLDRLKGRLEEIHAEEGIAGVSIFADKTVSYQALFRVMDQVRLAGVNRISLQAEVEQGS
ncbi:MAG: biopolymer transporter ExbD [Deltaproteobacteria bacterium]|nr:biopolymer transporter ExbD [Deltaproteobacteria bacterium]